MTRAEVLAKVLEFMGPLGPFVQPDERERDEANWAKTGAFDLVAPILALLTDPPSADELGWAAPNDFAFELALILAMIGERDPEAMLASVVPLLQDPVARPSIIEVFGALGLESGLTALEPFLEDPNLSEAEAVCLACSLGEIGGAQVPAMLDRLAAATPSTRTQVFEEIEIAREAVGQRRPASLDRSGS